MKGTFLGAIIFSILIGQHAFAGEIKCENLSDIDTKGKGSIEHKGNLWHIIPEKGTDLYASPDGKVSVNNVPSATFNTLNNFEFITYVQGEFNDAYDGAGIVVYANENNWAKLMFERFKSGKNGIASTVNRGNGDDAYHLRTDKSALYLKATKQENVYSFYYSFDGEEWLYTRSFKLAEQGETKVGIFAQSPLQGKMTARFQKTCGTNLVNK